MLYYELTHISPPLPFQALSTAVPRSLCLGVSPGPQSPLCLGPASLNAGELISLKSSLEAINDESWWINTLAPLPPYVR